MSFFESLVWLDLGLNPGLPDLWRTLYSLDQWLTGTKCICKHNYLLLSYLPNPSARAGYDTRSIFKWSLTGLNSEFSFSSTSCLPKAEELSLPYYFPHSWIVFSYTSPIIWGCRIRNTASLQRSKIPTHTHTHTNDCPGYNTKLHLMVRIQFWNLGECRVPLHCHYSHVNFDSLKISSGICALVRNLGGQFFYFFILLYFKSKLQ